MKIGELQRRTGVPVETIRYYEQKGLLPEPERHANNYRHYSDTHAERLAFIRHCRSLDMTLEEITVLLSVMDTPQASCATANQLLDEHIEHVVRRMEELRQLETYLRDLRSRCPHPDEAQHCGILAELANAPVFRQEPTSGRGL
ncbi:Cd(II)/Pb(II)-responsive transcriptional regulator [Paracandidimonas soli]|uniref:Cd(II)/Pb(II)-responsive transcriptional regulator n=2 Tax=Paracandidimonas soli TaxID=1917182 RepID=A0A4R3VBJ5_9BURK|nr:Cd(II)/Pb(II)-responsive transcriptional regulator [Paracandidimonas soli]TCV01441.1 Cd(II)/Pb(II)-responsive transcriptional regulator [Paracandidimonas soli]